MFTIHALTSAPTTIKNRASSSYQRLNSWTVWRGLVVGLVTIWMRRSRTRRELSELSDHELADIGVSRGQARFESDKAFWRP
jgi:uncharacterized protein YjiS (DUF1127 family)